jgi:diacylglycerol O-acyltransferase
MHSSFENYLLTRVSEANVPPHEPMARYFQEAFDMLEASVDDPSLNIEDIGKKVLGTPEAFTEDKA